MCQWLSKMVGFVYIISHDCVCHMYSYWRSTWLPPFHYIQLDKDSGTTYHTT